MVLVRRKFSCSFHFKDSKIEIGSLTFELSCKQIHSGVHWSSGRVSDSGSTGCKFDHCFNSLTAMGKLLTTNVHTLDPKMNEYLTSDILFLFYSSKIQQYFFTILIFILNLVLFFYFFLLCSKHLPGHQARNFFSYKRGLPS